MTSDRFQEADNWEDGDKESAFYQRALEQSKENPLAQHSPARGSRFKKILHPEEMAWEDSAQGRIKHMINEELAEEYDMPSRSANIYMQEIPPGSKSGKHRHMSEELIMVLEGSGYDHHWDPRIVLQEEGGSDWNFPDEPKRFEWGEEDVIYIPPNTVHQHVNASDEEPVRIICCQNRVYDKLGYGYNDIEQFEDAPEYGNE